MKKISTLLLFLVLSINGFGQTLSPRVLATAGGRATGGSVSLSFTMGVTFSNKLSSASRRLSQGQQQPEIDLLAGISQASACAGSDFPVPYTASGYVDPSNVFSAQLSNAAGSFSNPVSIGTSTSLVSGNISVVLPSGLNGSGYKLRVVSSHPYRIAGNFIALTIKPTSSTTESITACSTYTWHGTTYTASNNTATWTGSNAAGCDSVVRLNLTITPPPVWYLDADGDGYSQSASSVSSCLSPGSGYVLSTLGNDCDDADNTIWRTGIFYTDADGDNFTVGAAQTVCYGLAAPAGFSATAHGSDCDDGNPFLNVNCISYTWTGASNGDWNNASNWNSNVVPGGGTDVVIPAGTTNTISTGGTFNCHSATIQAGATVSISSGGVWNIGGNLQGAAGAVISGAGKVVLNGSSSQTISGTVSVSRLEIGNNAVQIATGSSLSILPTASTPNALLTLLPASAITNNGSLILRSNSFGTGSIAPVPANATLVGNITQERLLPSANGWYFVGAPVKSSALTEWSELNTRISPKLNASFFEYSETDSTTGEANEVYGWKVPNTLATAINPGNEPKGYRMYLGQTNPTRLASVTGLPFVQDVNKALSFSPTTGYAGGGWNLISNPYPCAINWNQMRNDAANSGLSLSNAYYTFNGAAGNYGTYTSLNASTGVGVGGLQENIASSQAFFVKASGSSTLAFKESFKNTAANSASFLRTATSELEFLKFKVQQGSNWDEAGVLFFPEAAEGLDNYDALNLTGSAVDVATVMAGGKNAAIEVLPQIGEQRILPLKVQTPASGAASFRFEGMENFPSTISMYLKDDFLGSLTDIRQNPEISFEAEAGQVYNRFSLILAEQVLTGSESKLLQKKLSLHPNPASNRVSVYSPAAGELELINALGQKITTQTIQIGRNEVNLTGLPKGMYQLRLKGWSVEKLIVE